MAVSSSYSALDKELKISISGRFDFSIQKEFREAYRAHDASLKYHVDLQNADYLDSSALGMLLLLRKHAGDEKEKVTVSGANAAVRKILDIAKFNKLFTIS